MSARSHLVLQTIGGLVAIIFIIIFVSCAPATKGDGVGLEVANPTTDITRYVDKEAGVVCWISWSNAISCMPIKDTLLSQ